MVSDERHKSAAFQHLCRESITTPLNELQFLMFRAPHGQNHPAAFGKLGKERFRNGGGGRSNEDRVERGELFEAKCTLPAMYMRPGGTDPGQLDGSAGSQPPPPVHGGNIPR